MFQLRRQSTPIAILLLVTIVLIFVDRSGVLRGNERTGRGWLAGISAFFTESVDFLGEWRFALTHFTTLKAENEQLRRQLDDFALLNARLIELENENHQLRALLEFKNAHPNYLLLVAEVTRNETPARVVSTDPNNLVRAVRINQGRAEGVDVGMPVVTARGLLGRVVDVGERWAEVMLIIDETSAVAALDQQSRAGGIVEGTGTGLVMRYIDNDQSVEPGDIILTSGLGGQFPKGLVIGTVRDVIRKDVNPYQEAIVDSPVDFNNVEYVFVVREFRPIAEEEVR
nr:rod shape-determining protein MreC [Ardenticatena sp.]